MNIYEKIQEVKSLLLKANLKKGGTNEFSNFTYYELTDILPTIIELCKEVKLFTAVTFTEEQAILKIVNSEKIEEIVEYTSPMRTLELKGCNQIQALGGVETYSRRYLYMCAFDITENDMFDGNKNNEELNKENKIIEETGNSPISETQLQALKQAMINLKMTGTQANILLNKYGYEKAQDIRMKDYVKIIQEIQK